MSTITLAASRRAAPASVGARLQHLWGAAFQAWRTRKASRAMGELSDAALHDIGVTRAEIDTVVRYGRPARS